MELAIMKEHVLRIMQVNSKSSMIERWQYLRIRTATKCDLCDFEGGPNFEYVLYSAIIHDGAAGSGHYFTLFRPEPTGTWMLANDSSVAVYAGDVQALLKQAFVLFYTKAM